MKKTLILVAATTIMFSCGKIESSINDLSNRLDQLEQKVATIDNQIEAVNTSIDQLEEVDNTLRGICAELENSNKELEACYNELKNANQQLSNDMESLRIYVNTQLSSTTDWVNATFATLEQQQTLLDDIARLEALVK